MITLDEVMKMYGIYLKCEKCDKTLGGEEVTPRQQGIPPLGRFEWCKLRELAAERGWTHTPPDDDMCPECSKPYNDKGNGPERSEGPR